MGPSGSIDRDRLASGISWLLAGIAVTVLDLRVWRLDVLFDPAGAALVLVGVLRVLAATPATRVAPWLRALAVLDLLLVVATEVGVLLGEVVVGAAGFPREATTTPTWQAVAAATQLTTAVGVLLLARHLRAALTGIASDRWRQVTIAWVVVLIAVPVIALVGVLELVFLGLAVVAIAGVLLVVALLATRRAAEEDALDREFER